MVDIVGQAYELDLDLSNVDVKSQILDNLSTSVFNFMLFLSSILKPVF